MEKRRPINPKYRYFGEEDTSVTSRRGYTDSSSKNHAKIAPSKFIYQTNATQPATEYPVIMDIRRDNRTEKEQLIDATKSGSRYQAIMRNLENERENRRKELLKQAVEDYNAKNKNKPTQYIGMPSGNVDYKAPWETNVDYVTRHNQLDSLEFAKERDNLALPKSNFIAKEVYKYNERNKVFKTQDYESAFESDKDREKYVESAVLNPKSPINDTTRRFDALIKNSSGNSKDIYDVYNHNRKGDAGITDKSYDLMAMNDKEKAVYNYMYAKYGKKKADNYRKSISSELRHRTSTILKERNDAKNGFVEGFNEISTAISSGTQRAVDDVFVGVPKMALEINTKSEPRITENVYARMIEDDTNNALVLGVANSAAYMAPHIVANMATSGATSAYTMGVGAAGGAYQDAINDGYSVEQAQLYGAFNGAMTVGLEKAMNGVELLGGGAVQKAINNGTVLRGISNVIKSPTGRELFKKATGYGLDMASEGVEEYLEYYAEQIGRNIILGENNSLDPMDEKAWEAAAIGALTAGMLNSPGTVKGTVNTYNTGKNSSISDYSAIAEGLDVDRNNYTDNKFFNTVSDTKAMAEFLSNKESKGKKIGNFEKGILENNLNTILSEGEQYHKPFIDNNTANINDNKIVQNKTVENIIKPTPIDKRAKQFPANGEQAYNTAYRDNLPIDIYDEGFKAAYNAGRFNGQLDEITHPSYHMLSDNQKNLAYEAGKADLRASFEKVDYKQGEQKSGGLVYTSDLSQEALNEFSDKAGKLTGLKMEIVDELPFDANGVYIPKKGSIQISLNAENTLAAMSHELTHFIKDYAVDDYAHFQQIVFDTLSKDVDMDIEDVISEYMARYEESGTIRNRDDIMDEITADATAHFMNDENFISEISTKNKSVARKIIDFFTDVIDNINSLIQKVKGNVAADRLKANKKAYEKARDLWLNALNKAGDNYRSGQEIDNSDLKAQNINEEQKFSLKEPVEEGEKLVAIHNVTSAKLAKIMELGAMPMPSIAVTKASMGHDNFGEISFVFDKSTIDPSIKGQKVYSADAWTPTFPIMEYEASMDKSWTLYRQLKPYIEKLPKNYAEIADRNLGTLYSDWNDYRGKDGFVDKFTNSENDSAYAMKALYLAKNGIDVSEFTKDDITKSDLTGYENWIRDIANDIEEASGIPNGKDIFTNSGNRRSFKQLHLEATAENIVKSMLTQGKNSKNIVGFMGSKSIRASAATSFKSLDDVRNSKNKLKQLSTEEKHNLTKNLDSKIMNIIDSIIYQNNKKTATPRDISSIGEIILEASEKKRITPDRVLKTFEPYVWDITREQAIEIADFINEIKGMPVDIFEAKPERVVKFDEIKYALVPQEDVKSIESLTEKGIEVIEYDSKNANARTEILNSLDDVKFSIKKDNNGKDVVVIDNILFDKKTQNIRSAVANNIRQNVGQFYNIVSNNKAIYLGKDLPGEYTRSEYSKRLGLSKLVLKSNASSNLGEMIEIADNESWVANKKAKHNIDAQNGWYKYDTRFAVQTPTEDRIYDAELIVRHDANGKLYLYDLLNIKRDPSAKFSIKTNLASRSQTIKNSLAYIDESLSESTISQEDSKSNTINQVNTKNNQSVVDDMKTSIKLNSSVDYKKVIKENRVLAKDNAELKRQFKLTKGYEPRAEDVEKISKNLIKKLDSRYDSEVLTENLTKLFKYVNKYDGEYTNDVMEVATSLARDIIDNSNNLDTTLSTYYKEALDEIKGLNIKLDENQKIELLPYGGYSEVKQKYDGMINLSEDGIGIEEAYNKLSDKYPWIFPSEIIDKGTMLTRVLEVFEESKGSYNNEYGLDNAELASLMAKDLFDEYLNVRASEPTFADNKRAELLQERFKYKTELKSVKAKLKQDYDAKVKSLQIANQETKKQLTKRYNEKLSKLKAQYSGKKTAIENAELKAKIRILTKIQQNQIEALNDMKVAMALARQGRRPFISPFESNNRELKRAYKEIEFPKKDNSTPYNVADIDEKLEAFVEKYGAIKKGVNPERDISIPNSTDGVTKVRKAARTILESDFITDDMVEPIKDDILKGAMSYEVLSDNVAKSNANYILESKGYEKALSHWKAIIESNKGADKNDIALAEILLREASDRGEAKTVLELTAQIAAEATRAGQTVQAIAMMKNLKNMGDMEYVGRLMYLKKSVEKINQNLAKKFGYRHALLGKDIPKVSINEELASRYVEADVSQRDGIFDEMMQDVADQIPVTIAEKWNAWRYFSMLGNAKTHIRNLAGNAIFVPAVKLKNFIGAGLEATFKIKERSKSLNMIQEIPLVPSKYKTFAKNDMQGIKDILGNNDSKGDLQDIYSRRKIFKSKYIGEAAEFLRKFNDTYLEKEDAIFLNYHYETSLASYLQANKVDIDNIDEALLMRAREYAIKEAKKATYRDASKLATKINEMKQTGLAGDLITSGIMPFTKTPLNIIKRGIEYSPAGLISALTKGSLDVKAGKITANEYIDGISAGISGSILTGVGYLLARLGILKVFGDDKEENALDRMRGRQNYSIEIAGYNIDLSGFAPTAIPLFVGAQMERLFREDEKLDGKDVMEGILSLADPMIDMSVLSGINNLVSSISYEENSSISTMMAVTIQSYLGQGIPTLVGQMARTISDTSKTTYIDKNSQLPGFMQSFIQKSIINKTPFINDLYGIDRVNEFGVVDRDTNVANRFFKNFISPIYYNKVNTTDSVYNELERLYKETGERGIVPDSPRKAIKIDSKTYNLNAEEYMDLKKKSGVLGYELLSHIIESKSYDDYDEVNQVKAVKMCYEYANAMAIKDLDENHNNDKWIDEAYELSREGVPITEYIIYKIGLEDVKSDKDINGKTIRGSLKENKLDYIKGLDIGIDSKQKLIRSLEK